MNPEEGNFFGVPFVYIPGHVALEAIDLFGRT